MTEIIHDADSSNNGLLAVILIIIIAIGGFLIWRFASQPQQQTQEPGGVNLQVNLPNGSSTSY